MNRPEFLDELSREILKSAQRRDRLRRRRYRTVIAGVALLPIVALASLATTRGSDTTTVATDGSSRSAPASATGGLAPPPAPSEARPPSTPRPGESSAQQPTSGPAAISPDAFEAQLLGERYGFSSVWTGSEIVVLGGLPLDGSTGEVMDGAAYMPSTGVWRELEPSPVGPRNDHVALWTGEEVIVLGGFTNMAELENTVVAYSVSERTWRFLPDLPDQAMHSGSPIATWYAGAAWWWNPESLQMFVLEGADAEAWTAVDGPEVDGYTFGAVFRETDAGLYLVVGGEGSPLAVGIKARVEQGWATSFAPPKDDGSPFDAFVSNSLTLDDGRLLVWARSVDPAFVFDPQAGTWEKVDPPPVPGCEGHAPPLSIANLVVLYANCADDPGRIVWSADPVDGPWSTAVIDIPGAWTEDVVVSGDYLYSVGGFGSRSGGRDPVLSPQRYRLDIGGG